MPVSIALQVINNRPSFTVGTVRKPGDRHSAEHIDVADRCLIEPLLVISIRACRCVCITRCSTHAYKRHPNYVPLTHDRLLAAEGPLNLDERSARTVALMMQMGLGAHSFPTARHNFSAG